MLREGVYLGHLAACASQAVISCRTDGVDNNTGLCFVHAARGVGDRSPAVRFDDGRHHNL